MESSLTTWKALSLSVHGETWEKHYVASTEKRYVSPPVPEYRGSQQGERNTQKSALSFTPSIPEEYQVYRAAVTAAAKVSQETVSQDVLEAPK